MRLIRFATAPEQFGTMSARLHAGSVFGFPLSRSGRAYYAATVERPAQDVSFLVASDNGALIAVAADVANGRLEHFGMPAQILCDPGDAPSIYRRALRETVGELRRIIAAHRLSAVDFITPSPGPAPDALAAALLSEKLDPEPYFCAVVDLAVGSDGLLGGMRKGHRQQVRWGQANLITVIIDGDRPDRDAFERYRHLHAQVAGRVTRSESSWNSMFEAVVAGEGRLVLSSLDDQLVGGTLILDAEDTAYYASGAYRREHFDKPLAHFPLFVAMQASAAAGRRWFQLGDVSNSPRLTEKERSIAYFKRGFVSQLRTALRWRGEFR